MEENACDLPMAHRLRLELMAYVDHCEFFYAFIDDEWAGAIGMLPDSKWKACTHSTSYLGLFGTKDQAATAVADWWVNNSS